MNINLLGRRNDRVHSCFSARAAAVTLLAMVATVSSWGAMADVAYAQVGAKSFPGAVAQLESLWSLGNAVHCGQFKFTFQITQENGKSECVLKGIYRFDRASQSQSFDQLGAKLPSYWAMTPEHQISYRNSAPFTVVFVHEADPELEIDRLTLPIDFRTLPVCDVFDLHEKGEFEEKIASFKRLKITGANKNEDGYEVFLATPYDDPREAVNALPEPERTMILDSMKGKGPDAPFPIAKLRRTLTFDAKVPGLLLGHELEYCQYGSDDWKPLAKTRLKWAIVNGFRVLESVRIEDIVGSRLYEVELTWDLVNSNVDKKYYGIDGIPGLEGKGIVDTRIPGWETRDGSVGLPQPGL